ncbi:MAG: hydrogenase maturation nickel metallochaperone HypA [Clostridiaceae bacterium]|jgi:hydrogenase nickel incorporation protein HypA/HybF|nr:hydrogenase maturation nickel metallochaperone HypA [Clostridiaceae bacterium]
MHELAVTKYILKLALDHTEKYGGREVLSIHLLIGEMRNLEEDWIQRYFNYISVGTAAEHAVINVRKVPIAFLCKICGKQFTGDLREDKKLLCTHCNSFEYDLISGRELIVEKLEIK